MTDVNPFEYRTARPDRTPGFRFAFLIKSSGVVSLILGLIAAVGATYSALLVFDSPPITDPLFGWITRLRIGGLVFYFASAAFFLGGAYLLFGGRQKTGLLLPLSLIIGVVWLVFGKRI